MEQAQETDPAHLVDVVVIGAGQAGIAAARELQRRGFVGYSRAATRPGESTSVSPNFVVLDANPTPGGAWSHRWNSLTMATVNHIADLPGLHAPDYSPTTRANIYVPAYFAQFEDKYDLPIFRPVRVLRVEDERGEITPRPGSRAAQMVLSSDVDLATQIRSRLRVVTTSGTWLARYIINATGTWTRPFIPYYPGTELFAGKQYHTANYRDKEDFWRLRVLVVGGGISALEHIAEVSTVAKKVQWVTRNEPRFVQDDTRVGRSLTADEGHAVEERAYARVAAGYLPESIVAATGIPRVAWVRDMEKRGLLKRKPMFTRLDVDGAWWDPVHKDRNAVQEKSGGKFERFDAIIWATGFRSELRHLAPLKLRTIHGGVAMDDTHVSGDPRIHLVGHGPSQSTIGARHWSRVAVKAIMDDIHSR
ncbi:NAD(P)-binding domain-containing protein [Arcanobacterium canis]